MGNREDLIAGAKRCILDKGYGRTTARDIAEASGVSLAAIGYHFGSKDALLNEAMFALFDDWGEQMAQGYAGDNDSEDPTQRFGAIMDQLLAMVTQNRRLVAATFEAFPQSEHVPALQAQLAKGQEAGRRGLVSFFHGVEEDEVSDTAVRTLGSLYFALMTGILAQWLTDPQRAPSGPDLAAALRTLANGDPLPE